MDEKDITILWPSLSVNERDHPQANDHLIISICISLKTSEIEHFIIYVHFCFLFLNYLFIVICLLFYLNNILFLIDMKSCFWAFVVYVSNIPP